MEMLSSLFGFKDPVMSIDLDFTEGDKGQFEENSIFNVDELLLRSNNVFKKLSTYKGCGAIIQQALKDYQNIDLLRESFETISPNIETICEFYHISSEIVQAIERVTTALQGGFQQFQRQSKLSRILGRLLLFCFEFDQAKMSKPELQNDFSFYRRCLTSPHIESLNKPVAPDLAPEISMWIAESLPMFASITPKTVHGKVHRAIPLENTETLAILANICCGMVQRQRCGASMPLVFKMMVAATIAFDRASERGAFHSRSPIKISRVVAVIAKHGGADKGMLQASLKFSTIHFKDADTSNSVKAALDS